MTRLPLVCVKKGSFSWSLFSGVVRPFLGMVRYAGAGSRLRALFQDVPESLLPKPEPPSRLTDEDFRLNYRSPREDARPARSDLTRRGQVRARRRDL